jgi:toxin ParE1/3/4
MRIRWTHAAAKDLEHIKDYLTEHSPQLAQSTVIELYESIRSLKTSPRRGRLGREKGTRELVFSRLPYIVAYRLKEQAIEVLHIFHGAQDRP